MSGTPSPNDEALVYARGILDNAYTAPTDPDGRVPPRAEYTYKRLWPEVRTGAARRAELRAGEARRTAAMGSGGIDRDSAPRAMPPDLTPWAARSRVPFTLPALGKRRHSKPPSAAKSPRGRANARVPTSLTPDPAKGRLGEPRRKLLITPRTYEAIKLQPTPETSEAVVEQLSSVIMSHNRLQWSLVHGQHTKSAKEIAAERRAKTLALLEALARPSPPATAEEESRSREGFACLASPDGTVSCEVLHAHMSRADLVPNRRLATVRRGYLTFEALMKCAFGM